MTRKVIFDLDGTVYDLYNVEDWLGKIQREEAGVFTEGDILFELDEFYSTIEEMLMNGIEFGVITWLPAGASKEYEEVCRKEKLEFINKYLPFVSEVSICSYGIPKQNLIKKRAAAMYLLDDNKDVCEMFNQAKNCVGINVEEGNLVQVLRNLMKFE